MLCNTAQQCVTSTCDLNAVWALVLGPLQLLLLFLLLLQLHQTSCRLTKPPATFTVLSGATQNPLQCLGMFWCYWLQDSGIFDNHRSLYSSLTYILLTHSLTYVSLMQPSVPTIGIIRVNYTTLQRQRWSGQFLLLVHQLVPVTKKSLLSPFRTPVLTKI